MEGPTGNKKEHSAYSLFALFSRSLVSHLVLAEDIAFANDKEKRVCNLPSGARNGNGDWRLHLKKDRQRRC